MGLKEMVYLILIQKKFETMEQIELKDNKLISGYMPSLIGHSLFSKNDFEKNLCQKIS